MSTILVNTPISSPLHPQLNLPLLQGYLTARGYQVRVCDTNIQFYHYFLGETPRLDREESLKNPLSILKFYSDIENALNEKSRQFDGLHVGLRSLAMKYDRTTFEGVLLAIYDKTANPFIAFYTQWIDANVDVLQTKLLGIAITFQDQLIPAFTLARLVREKAPQVKIVMGGQMVTRCYESMVDCASLCGYFDYLSLWDGEKGLHDIHREIVDGEHVEFVNVIKVGETKHRIARKENSPSAQEIPFSDFSDIDFNQYFYPEILVPLQTTRGCYAECAFCAIPFGANGYKVRAPRTVVDDMVRIQELIFEKTGRKATYFKFMEDTSAPSVLHKIAAEIELRQLDIKWETFARLEKAFTKPGVMNDLYRGGCRKIHWGLESNDPAVLKDMNKNTLASYSDDVLRLSGEAGILNFCFILAGFPGESDASRRHLVNYIIGNPHIHTLTLATFDLTRGSPMERDFTDDNIYKLEMAPAQDFQVRLPYLVNGENWKAKIIPIAHQMMIDIIKGRPDIGFMTLFPDQVRAVFCEEFGNEWGKIFVERYGKEGVTEMLLNAEKYARDYAGSVEMSADKLPEPIRREHFRSKEDLALIARAMTMRKSYETNRFNQV